MDCKQKLIYKIVRILYIFFPHAYVFCFESDSRLVFTRDIRSFLIFIFIAHREVMTFFPICISLHFSISNRMIQVFQSIHSKWSIQKLCECPFVSIVCLAFTSFFELFLKLWYHRRIFVLYYRDKYVNRSHILYIINRAGKQCLVVHLKERLPIQNSTHLWLLVDVCLFKILRSNLKLWLIYNI